MTFGMRGSYWPLALAIVVGFAMVPPLEHAYDDWLHSRIKERELGAPVVSMQGRIVSRGADFVVLHIAGQKLRECRYVGLVAYTVNAEGVRFDAIVKREDTPETGDTKQPGAYDIGRWRVWPTHPHSRRALVMVDHLCNGVQVRSLIAEVDL